MRFARLFFLLTSLFTLCAAPAMATDVGMVTGTKAGTYYAFGQDIASVAKGAGVSVEIKESNGSIDNIKRITSTEKVGLGIVQSDVLGFLSRSQNPESVAIAKKLRLVVPFYKEEVHVLAKKNIASFADLAGKRVVVGSEGSGSMLTAVNLFSVLGVKPAKMYQITPPEGVVAVLNDNADAVIFVGGKPVKMFKNMEKIGDIESGPNAGKLSTVHFLPLADERLMKEYSPAVLTTEDYDFIDANVPTVAVTAVMVSYDYTRKDTPYYNAQCGNVRKIVQALRDQMDFLQANGHPKWQEVDLDADIGVWTRDVCSMPKDEAKAAAPAPAPEAKQPQPDPLQQDLLRIIIEGK